MSALQNYQGLLAQSAIPDPKFKPGSKVIWNSKVAPFPSPAHAGELTILSAVWNKQYGIHSYVTDADLNPDPLRGWDETPFLAAKVGLSAVLAYVGTRPAPQCLCFGPPVEDCPEHGANVRE